jgi:hypothetical protein
VHLVQHEPARRSLDQPGSSDRRLRFALCKGGTERAFRKGGRKGGRSHLRKQARNEFKIGHANPDRLRKHTCALPTQTSG